MPSSNQSSDAKLSLSPEKLTLFWSKVDKSGECWTWTGAKDWDGYGAWGFKGFRNQRAHRISFQLHHRILTAGECVCHTCDNPSCVHPLHLFAGSQADNQRDMIKKGRDRKASGDDHYMRRRPGLRSGDKNPNALLTTEGVAFIRSRYAAGGISQLALAIEFGVSQMTISKALRNKTWRATA